MTLTQVSTWFANARRRLKKENKWSPDAGFEDDEEKGKYFIFFKIKNSLFFENFLKKIMVCKIES